MGKRQTPTAIYARVSTETQEKQQTIESQLAELRRHAAARGLTMARDFVDDGYSGAMLDLRLHLPAAANPQTRDRLTRQIADTDRAIDQLVYELYGLTDGEIALVEGRA